MAIRKYWLLGLVAVGMLLLARTVFWTQPPPEPKHSLDKQSVPVARIKQNQHSISKATTPKQMSAPRPHTVADKSSQYQNQNPDDPRLLFENPAASVSQRFSALVRLEQSGNAEAKYFALQIARHCAQISKIAQDQPAQGQAAATPYQIQLRAQMKAACVLVMSDAAFPEFAKMMESHTDEAFAERMRQTLRLFFADKGPEAMIHAAVSAIAQRPDDVTLGMVADTFADLDIESIYFEQDSTSVAPVDPQKRIELTRFALNLLACHYGQPCGPNSYVVQTTCTQLGACMPGADLLGVYKSQMLTPQEMDYVQLLLEYLKHFPPNVVW